MDIFDEKLINNLEIAKKYNLLNIIGYSYISSHIIIKFDYNYEKVYPVWIWNKEYELFKIKLNRIVKLNKIKNE